MATKRLEFTFNGMPVGIFEETEYPRQSGLYHYLPFRCPGHYHMQMELSKQGSARCHYKVGPKQVFFTVVDCPRYGILELADFEIQVKAASPDGA